MKLMIDIPDKDIPPKQGMLNIDVHFIDGKVCECDYPFTQEPETDILDKIRAEIEQIKLIMNEEIVNHDRKDLINFINGINQCLVIIDKYRK